MEKEIADDWPEYSSDWKSKVTNVWQFINYFRYALNFWLFGIPYTLFMLICIGYNLVFNIWCNKMWVNMNSYLLFNTIYIVVQGTLSLFLAFELPLWLKHFKVLRLASFLAAWIYTIIYLVSCLKVYSMIYWEDHEDIGYEYMFIVMFLSYNAI